MSRLTAAFAAAACLAAPGIAFADMSCAEFGGMDMDSQRQIVGAMVEAGEAGTNAMSTTVAGDGDDAEVTASDDMVRAVQSACGAAPGRALGDAVRAAAAGG